MTPVFSRVWGLGFGLLLWINPLYAFAERPLVLVTPYPATGTPDIEGTQRMTKMVRLTQALSTPSLTDVLVQGLAGGLGAALDQTVQIERKAGNHGAEGLRFVSNALPDGQTLLFSAANLLEPRDPRSGAATIALPAPWVKAGAVADLPMALVAEERAGAPRVRDWIAKARAHPGQINFATLTLETSSFLAARALQKAASIELLLVEHNGASAALNAVATRTVELALVPLPATLPYINGGKLNALALSSAVRHPALPGVPTLEESGVAGFSSVGRFAIYAATATPAKTIVVLRRAIDSVVDEEGWRRFLFARGLLPPLRTMI